MEHVTSEAHGARRAIGDWLVAGAFVWLQETPPAPPAPTPAIVPGGPIAAPWSAEPVYWLSALDNGDFRARAAKGIPWWRVSGADARVVEARDGGPALEIRGETTVEQPIAAFAPSLEHVRVRGTLWGDAVLTLVVGSGGVFARELYAQPARPIVFDESLGSLRASFAQFAPPITLQLSSSSEGAIRSKGYFAGFEVLVPLPCPGEEALAGEIERELHRVLDPLAAAGLDERPWCFSVLLHANAAAHDPAWDGLLTRYLEHALVAWFDPEAQLSRATRDGGTEPAEDVSTRMLAEWTFLLDAAEIGPREQRSRALAAAEMMERFSRESFTTQRAALDRPWSDHRSGSLEWSAAALRLARITGSPDRASELRAAAERALEAELRFRGDAGPRARSAQSSAPIAESAISACFGVFASACPWLRELPASRRLRSELRTAWEALASPWALALAAGGSFGPTEPDSWGVLAAWARVELELCEPILQLVRDSRRACMKSTQTSGGAWLDVEFSSWKRSPARGGGVEADPPLALLAGLAALYGRGSPLRDAETRALFTSVLRSTIALHVEGDRGAQHGDVDGGARATRFGHAGPAAPAIDATPRYAAALVAMLEGLRSAETR